MQIGGPNVNERRSGEKERKKVKNSPINKAYIYIYTLGHEGHRGCRNMKMSVLLKDANYNMDIASLYTFDLK